MATVTSDEDIQNGIQQRERSPWGTILLLPAALAAVWIAAEYNAEKSPCRKPIHGEEYIVELQLFCNIGGYLLIAEGGLGVIYGCIAKTCLRNNVSAMKVIGYFCCLPLACAFLFFYLAWAAIGLFMYNVQMRKSCKDTDIGAVILAWSLIPYCLIARM